MKLQIVETTRVPTGSAPAVSRKGNPSPSFFEIAAQVAADVTRDVNAPREAKQEKPAKSFSLWENSKMGFGDFIDIINPLQHLPIIATIYRNRTGDSIGFAPRVLGGALWGRIGGFVTGLVNGVVERLTGKDIGDHIYAAFFGRSVQSKGDQMAAKSVESPPDSPMFDSAFGDFDDDGGFFVAGRTAKRVASLALQSTPLVSPDLAAALNSYERNIGLDESDEPFRFRFPV